jgi:hypothetical protein
MGVKLDKDLMADFNSNLNIFLFLNLDCYHMYGFLVYVVGTRFIPLLSVSVEGKTLVKMIFL